MKIAIFVDNFPVCSQTFVINQVLGLLELGVDVTVLVLASRTEKSNAELDGIYPGLSQRTFFLLQEQYSSALGKASVRLNNVLQGLLKKKTRTNTIAALNSKLGQQAKSLLLASIASKQVKPLVFDVILCHFGQNGVVANKLRQIGVLEGKVATIFHGFDISAKSALVKYQLDYQALFAQTELMLPISDKWKNKLISLGCEQEKITVHRMGIDLELFEFSSQPKAQPQSQLINSKCLTLFTVARFSEKKGLEYAIRALIHLPEEVNCHYIIGGFGELEQSLKQLVIELYLTNKVTFLGPLTSVQVKERMQTADVFIQPSITADNGDMEGVPVAIMEAMAVGVPVISTFHSGIPELITHNEHGLLAKERDALALADNISCLYRDDGNLATKFRQNARLRIEAIADVEKLNQGLVELLTTLANKR